jgi:hypothetical protein
MSTRWFGRRGGKATRQPAERRSVRPRLETLEDRSVPSGLVVHDLTTGVMPNNLVDQLLGPQFAAVSQIKYTGSTQAAGVFSGGQSILGIDSGIVLDTGKVSDLPGPNTGGSGTNFGLPGDIDLNRIVAPTLTQDASVLEFDFVPKTSTITFNYVFGSQEYNTRVNSGFPDVFGLYINDKNYALVPGTNPAEAVTVDTINLNSNSQFFINNAIPPDPFPTTNPINIHLNGITTVLTATAPVVPGRTNHIKFAIADAGDGINDSAAFIQIGPPPPAGTQVVPDLVAYRPFRYAFRSLEENQGGPFLIAPISGVANMDTFDGNITVVNTGDVDVKGPLTLTFHNLPEGVTLVNATGSDPKTGEPTILVSIDSLPVDGVLRVPVKLRNPLHKPLGTFFEGPYTVDVAQTVPAF